MIDNHGEARPYLASDLPRLNTDTWRVFSDGRMETIWKFRPGLIWQDGTPLTADDFVFAMRVYKASGLAVFVPKPQDRIDELVAIDPTTLLVRWQGALPPRWSGPRSATSPHPGARLRAYEQDPRPARPVSGSAVLDHRVRRRRAVSTGRPGSPPRTSKAWRSRPRARKTKIERVIIRLNERREHGPHEPPGRQCPLDHGPSNPLRARHGAALASGAGKGEGAGGSVPGHLDDDGRAPVSAEAQKSPPLLDARVRRALSSRAGPPGDRRRPIRRPGARAAHVRAADASLLLSGGRRHREVPLRPASTEQLMSRGRLRRDRDALFAARRASGSSRLLDQRRCPARAAARHRHPLLEGAPASTSSRTSCRPRWSATRRRGRIPGDSGPRDRAVRASLGREHDHRADRYAVEPLERTESGRLVEPEYDRLWDAYNATLDRRSRCGSSPR